jgi:hypothetical protein
MRGLPHKVLSVSLWMKRRLTQRATLTERSSDQVLISFPVFAQPTMSHIEVSAICSSASRAPGPRVIPAAELANDELKFTFERADESVGATKLAFEQELGRVTQYLGWLRENAAAASSLLQAERGA